MHLNKLSKLPLISTSILLFYSPMLAVAENGSAPCSLLSSLLQDKVSYPDAKTYIDSINSYFFQEARLLPSCVVSPASASDVSLIVSTMMGLRQNGSKSSAFAVRSGGHTPFAGAANIKNGVTIDLRNIDNISVNSNKSITSVGAGSIWSNIYAALTPLNLTVLGARVAGLGVGGFSTGGKFRAR